MAVTALLTAARRKIAENQARMADLARGVKLLLDSRAEQAKKEMDERVAKRAASYPWFYRDSGHPSVLVQPLPSLAVGPVSEHDYGGLGVAESADPRQNV